MAADRTVRACAALAGLVVQTAQPTVAVGLERAHAQFLGQGEGLAVVGYGWLALRGIAMRGNVAEEAQGIRLVAPFLVLDRRAPAPAQRERAPPPGGQPADAPPPGRDGRRLIGYYFLCRSSVPAPASAAARRRRRAQPRVYACAQGRSHHGEYSRAFRFLTDAHGPFE